MSYILDALRRADSERGRGAVPGLHSQQGSTRAEEKPPPSNNRLLIGVIVLLVVALLGALAWNGWSSSPPAEPVPVARPAVPALRSAAVPVPPSVLELPEPVPGPAHESPRPVARKPAGLNEGAASAPPRESRIVGFGELPEAVRRELPTLTVGGASHSENTASRMLILNGQVFHEGDRVAPGLTLEQIQLKTAVLAYRGYRYRIDF